MKRANIESAPRVVRELLDRAIAREGFANYKALAEEFKRFGKGFSRSGIHRYAEKLNAFQERARLEAQIIASLGDDAAWLLQWAREHPQEAARLVARLRGKTLKQT